MVGDLMSTILPHMVWRLSVNLECRSETCCARLAENTARKKSPKSRHLGTIPQLCRAISSQLRLKTCYSVSQLCGVEQRVRPIFGRAAITLGIGPHSSYYVKCFAALDCETLT